MLSISSLVISEGFINSVYNLSVIYVYFLKTSSFFLFSSNSLLIGLVPFSLKICSILSISFSILAFSSETTGAGATGAACASF